MSENQASKNLLLCGLLLLALFPQAGMAEKVRHDFPYESHYIKVLGSNMHYVDTGGSGSTVVIHPANAVTIDAFRNIHITLNS